VALPGIEEFDGVYCDRTFRRGFVAFLWFAMGSSSYTRM
jgi:hypothetical protein